MYSLRLAAVRQPNRVLVDHLPALRSCSRLDYCIFREFRDVVFEYVVFDNNRFDLIL